MAAQALKDTIIMAAFKDTMHPRRRSEGSAPIGQLHRVCASRVSWARQWNPLSCTANCSSIGQYSIKLCPRTEALFPIQMYSSMHWRWIVYTRYGYLWRSPMVDKQRFCCGLVRICNSCFSTMSSIHGSMHELSLECLHNLRRQYFRIPSTLLLYNNPRRHCFRCMPCILRRCTVFHCHSVRLPSKWVWATSRICPV